MKYKVLHNNIFTCDEFSIHPIHEENMEPIRIWRNEQMEVLRQNKELSSDDQLNYFNGVVKPLFELNKPSQLLFGFYKNTDLIGYGGLVHISWIDLRAEMSFLVNTKLSKDAQNYKESMKAFISLILKLVFVELKFNKVFTETYDFRTLHISILEESGYKVEGILREHICVNNKYYNSIIHSILKKEYEQF